MTSLSRKPCVQCRFHVIAHTDYWGPRATPVDMCSRRSTHFLHPITGEKIENTELWPCAYERKKASWLCSIILDKCGPDGDYFEQKNKKELEG